MQQDFTNGGHYGSHPLYILRFKREVGEKAEALAGSASHLQWTYRPAGDVLPASLQYIPAHLPAFNDCFGADDVEAMEVGSTEASRAGSQEEGVAGC